MSRRILRTLAICGTLMAMVFSGGAAQVARPDNRTATPPIHPLVASSLLDLAAIRDQEPPQVRRDRTRGALWGGGIGLVAGGVLGGLSVGADDQGDGSDGSLVEGAATGEAVILGALLGAGVGALLGATVFAPSRRRESGDGGDVAFSIDPTPSRVSLAARVRVGR